MRSQCENLRAFLVGDLGLFGRLRMRLHFRSCVGCRTDLQEFRRLVPEAELFGNEHLPASLRDRVMAEATAAASARAQSAASTTRRLHAQRFTAKRVLLASAFAALLITIGLGLFPRGRENTALADVARAMSRVGSVHFIGWRTDRTGKPYEIEGWLEGSSRLRLCEHGDNYLQDFADDGRTTVEVNTWARPPYATIYRSQASDSWPMGVSIDLFRGKGLLRHWENPLHPFKLTSRQTTMPGGRKAVVYELKWEEQRTLLTVDADSDLILKIENFKNSGDGRKVHEAVESIEYNRDIPDSIFRPSVPKGIQVLDLTKPVPAQVVARRQAEMKRLREDPDVDVQLHVDGSRRSSGGAIYRPAYRFEVAGTEVMVAYVPKLDVYRVVGRVRVYSEDGSYSRYAEDQDIRLPGRPDLHSFEKTLMRDSDPGAYRGLEHSDPQRGFRRFVNVGDGPLTILYDSHKDVYVIKGTAKLLPFGIVYRNQSVKNCDLSDIDQVKDPSKLDWGGLPASEVEIVKSELDIPLRVREIFRTRDAEGRVLVDGERVRITNHCDGAYCSGRIKIEPAGIGPTATTLGIKSKRVYIIIGRVKVWPSGEICKNGRVSFDGKVLASEE